MRQVQGSQVCLFITSNTNMTGHPTEKDKAHLHITFQLEDVSLHSLQSLETWMWVCKYKIVGYLSSNTRSWAGWLYWHRFKLRRVLKWRLLFYILATSTVISEWVRLVTVRTHGDLIVLPHWETRPSAPWPTQSHYRDSEPSNSLVRLDNEFDTTIAPTREPCTTD